MRGKITPGVAAVLAFALGATAAAAAAKADFSGAWALDKARSEGLPPGMDQSMTVTHTGDTIKLETRVVTEEGEQTVSDSYTLSGAETEFAPPGPNGSKGKGKRTAKWTADGNGIEVAESASFDTPEGAVTVKMSRKWSLAADGKTLTIELRHEGPQGIKESRRTFVRK
jgi:hypothetical protein